MSDQERYFLDLPPGYQLGQATYDGNLSDGSKLWHEQRKKGIGGSDIGAIAKVPGSFKSLKRVWLERAGFLPPETITPEKQELFDMGHAIEPATTTMLLQKLDGYYGEGWRAFQTGSWHSTGASWHLANPDRFLLTPENALTIAELKYSSRGYGWESYGAPAHYVAQLRWYLAAFGIDYGFLAAWVSAEVIVFRVPLDSAQPVLCLNDGSEEYYGPSATDLVIAADKFMSSLPNEANPEGWPPPNDGDEVVRSYYVNKHPDIEDRDVEVSAEVANEFIQARNDFDAAEERLNKAKSDIAELIGGAKRAVFDEGGKTPRVIARRQVGKNSVALYAGRGRKLVTPPETTSDATTDGVLQDDQEENKQEEKVEV